MLDIKKIDYGYIIYYICRTLNDRRITFIENL